MKRLCIIALLICFIVSSCSITKTKQKPLPVPNIDENSMFGVDKNINMTTIDNYLGRDDVEYIDVRMLFDPADFGAIGGEADLTRTIHGFKIVPYPYIATLMQLPVGGAYTDQCLFTVNFNENGDIESVKSNFVESEMILDELFPKDKVIFLMCGGGGYSGMMKSLLIYLGWDEMKIYNTGGNWNYTGKNTLELVIYPEDADGEKIYASWRADYVYIDFDRLNRV